MTKFPIYERRPHLDAFIPVRVEAIRFSALTGFSGLAEDFFVLDRFAKIAYVRRPNGERQVDLLTGKDGARGWVPIPDGHWLVREPGDPSDVWLLDPGTFHARYQRSRCPVCASSTDHGCGSSWHDMAPAGQYDGPSRVLAWGGRSPSDARARWMAGEPADRLPVAAILRIRAADSDETVPVPDLGVVNLTANGGADWFELGEVVEVSRLDGVLQTVIQLDPTLDVSFGYPPERLTTLLDAMGGYPPEQQTYDAPNAAARLVMYFDYGREGEALKPLTQMERLTTLLDAMGVVWEEDRGASLRPEIVVRYGRDKGHEKNNGRSDLHVRFTFTDGGDLLHMGAWT